MLTNIDTIIFDMDGTLLDSMGMWKDIDRVFLGKFNLECPKGFAKEIEGIGYEKLAAYFKKRFPVIAMTEEEIMEEWHQMSYEKYLYDTKLKNGALELLKYCKSNNIKTGIATSNSLDLVEASRKAHNLDSYIDVICTSNEVAHSKPAPDVYLAVANRLESKPENCLVFEDITAGIMAGKNAGMRTCFILDDASKYDWDEKKSLADFWIKDFTQVLDNTYYKRGELI